MNYIDINRFASYHFEILPGVASPVLDLKGGPVYDACHPHLRSLRCPCRPPGRIDLFSYQASYPRWPADRGKPAGSRDSTLKLRFAGGNGRAKEGGGEPFSNNVTLWCQFTALKFCHLNLFLFSGRAIGAILNGYSGWRVSGYVFTKRDAHNSCRAVCVFDHHRLRILEEKAASTFSGDGGVLGIASSVGAGAFLSSV